MTERSAVVEELRKKLMIFGQSVYYGGLLDAYAAACRAEGAAERRLIVFDVDMVLGDGNVAPKCRHLEGLQQLTDVLMLLGYEQHAWSAGGKDHAIAVVEHAHIHGAIPHFRCHDKPPFPMQEADALAVLGARPLLQIDDDQAERVADWPFMLADGWYVAARAEKASAPAP